MSDENDTNDAAHRLVLLGFHSVARRFVLLGGECYYAKGGFNDFLSSHDTLADALAASRRLENKRYGYGIEWWHVWDCETRSVVAMSTSQAHGASDSGPTLDGVRSGGP